MNLCSPHAHRVLGQDAQDRFNKQVVGGNINAHCSFLGTKRGSLDIDLQLFQQLGLAGGLQSVQHLAQVALHDVEQLVEREVDAVVGQPPLWKVVGADAVAAVAAAHQTLTQR